MKKINNKGYMLVEIILAFSIAFALVYFIMELVIKAKNSNDDLFVETVITTDQTIITNELMEYAVNLEDNFDCSKLIVDGNKITYDGNVLDVVSDYAYIDDFNNTRNCKVVNGKVSINIPIKVKQMKDKIFDVVIDYKYEIADMVPPVCSISAIENSTTLDVSYSDNSGIVGYYFGTINPDGNTVNYQSMDLSTSGIKKQVISATGTYYFGFKDVAGNTVTCSGASSETSEGLACSWGYPNVVDGICYYNRCNPQYGTWQDCEISTGERAYNTYSCGSNFVKLSNDFCWKNNS